jgi:hypothetical protein
MRRFILSSVLTFGALILMAVTVMADSIGPGV